MASRSAPPEARRRAPAHRRHAVRIGQRVPQHRGLRRRATSRYRDRRLLVLYFDQTSHAAGRSDARCSTTPRKFIDTQMTAAGPRRDHDLPKAGPCGCGRTSPTIARSCDEVIIRILAGDDLDGDGMPDTTDDIGTAFGQDDAEFNILNTDRQLSALQTAVGMLRPLPEQKSLVYFASGLRLNGVDNQAQLRATINAAIRANVSIYPSTRADCRDGAARRRHGPRPAASACSRAGPRRRSGQLPALAGHAVRARQRHRRQGAVRLQRPLARHRAGRRGGHRATTSSATTAPTRRLDGKFRRVRVTLAGGLSADLRTARDTSPTRSSRNSRPPTRNASSRRRSCSRTRHRDHHRAWR